MGIKVRNMNMAHFTHVRLSPKATTIDWNKLFDIEDIGDIFTSKSISNNHLINNINLWIDQDPIVGNNYYDVDVMNIKSSPVYCIAPISDMNLWIDYTPTSNEYFINDLYKTNTSESLNDYNSDMNLWIDYKISDNNYYDDYVMDIKSSPVYCIAPISDMNLWIDYAPTSNEYFINDLYKTNTSESLNDYDSDINIWIDYKISDNKLFTTDNLKDIIK